MGLFHRPTVASPSGNHAFTDVIQNEGNNTGRGIIAWRDPRTDFNTHSKLLVRRGEEAIFENGASEWVVFPGGTECELSTQNIAIIRSFREALSGGQSYFPCRVYFVSTEQFEIEWGTISPIGYTCPLLGPGAQLRGGGRYIIRVIDTETFVKTILRDNNSYTITDLKTKFFDQIFKKIQKIISSILETNGINSMEVSKSVEEIAEKCKPGIQDLLQPYGIMLDNFTVELELDEEQRQMYEQAIRLQRMNAQGEAQARIIGAHSKVEEMEAMGGAYTTIKGMELLQTIAENPGSGGIANAGAGIGMGMAAGGAFNNIAQTVFSNGQTQTPPQPQTQQFGGANRFGVDSNNRVAPETGQTESDPKDSLFKMKQLLDAGLITQDMYDTKVAEILKRL